MISNEKSSSKQNTSSPAMSAGSLLQTVRSSWRPVISNDQMSCRLKLMNIVRQEDKLSSLSLSVKKMLSSQTESVLKTLTTTTWYREMASLRSWKLIVLAVAWPSGNNSCCLSICPLSRQAMLHPLIGLAALTNYHLS